MVKCLASLKFGNFLQTRQFAKLKSSPSFPITYYVHMVLHVQALDGKVERDENGKEVRYPVLLTAQEKLIARKIFLAFKVRIHSFIVMECHLRQWQE